jgi:Domain of unknown function (DUF5668)
VSIYTHNRSCSCARCRTRDLTGAALLVTLGILFLLHEYLRISFHQTWPALLIVTGLLIYAGHAASTQGHIEPYRRARGSAPPPESDRGPDQPGPEVHL